MRSVNLALSNDQASIQLGLQAVFRTGAPIRGLPQPYKPSFKEKIKLCFSDDFKLTIAGHPIKSNWWLKARAIFERKFTLHKQGKIYGRGFFTQDLLKMGYSERELERLAAQGLLDKVTTRWQGGFRNTFVCRMDVNEQEIINATK